MSIKELLGGVRVLQPSAENLRDPPPLDVFDTFPYCCFSSCHFMWSIDVHLTFLLTTVEFACVGWCSCGVVWVIALCSRKIDDLKGQLPN